MGSFSHVTFNDYPIFTNKNSYFKDVVRLIFLQSDFIEEERSNSTLNKLVWDEAEEGLFIFNGFRQTAKVCLKRLEIYGMTNDKAKKDFEKSRLISKEEYIYQFPIEKVSYKKYLETVRQIIYNKEKNYDNLYTNIKESLIAGELQIVGQNLSALLYSILDSIPEDSIIEYDLTEVIEGGWVDKVEAKKINIEKIIVLTEGKSDVEFIKNSLNQLYPFLHPYYHFMNFDEFKVESNASALVKLVTSLAAANIKHPIVVLFDNDTTGIMEMKKLLMIKLPDNFKVLKLPDLKFAKKHPTIGPSGFKIMDVNGLACGIEMYLGLDVLTKNGDLLPVQWKALNEKENKYQGEILEKGFVQQEFRAKLKTNSTCDLIEMKEVLNLIFNAYN